MQIQSSQAKLPLPRMTIRALEVGRPSLANRVNIPTAASLVRNQWQLQRIRDLLNKSGILAYRRQPVRDGQVRPLEVTQDA